MRNWLILGAALAMSVGICTPIMAAKTRKDVPKNGANPVSTFKNLEFEYHNVLREVFIQGARRAGHNTREIIDMLKSADREIQTNPTARPYDEQLMIEAYGAASGARERFAEDAAKQERFVNSWKETINKMRSVMERYYPKFGQIVEDARREQDKKAPRPQ